jgi:hypothetical protein
MSDRETELEIVRDIAKRYGTVIDLDKQPS